MRNSAVQPPSKRPVDHLELEVGREVLAAGVLVVEPVADASRAG